MTLLLFDSFLLYFFVCGGVAELADAHDLGSCGEIRVGSSPTFPTIQLIALRLNHPESFC
jgi:hypothetical protein